MMNLEDTFKALDLPSRLMTETEVAKKKCCSVQSLRNQRHLGVGLPYIKNGRSVRYSPIDVAIDILKNRIDPEGRYNVAHCD